MYRYIVFKELVTTNSLKSAKLQIPLSFFTNTIFFDQSGTDELNKPKGRALKQ